MADKDTTETKVRPALSLARAEWWAETKEMPLEERQSVWQATRDERLVKARKMIRHLKKSGFDLTPALETA
ncbi:hypothetical protein FDP22_22770 (plasmid) [Paroceanicella profunda]|uniref:Uncharacterized protein n=1 Tax=Paroceanicella profunda TaxID=2579971 RepID=A0A5B8G6I5_9RHOB|nr:hypothetical protein [Paroceanicella profunda]QDL94703.1 hypothetical protein FDP22_22770 [Paroceanicella profunda]